MTTIYPQIYVKTALIRLAVESWKNYFEYVGRVADAIRKQEKFPNSKRTSKAAPALESKFKVIEHSLQLYLVTSEIEGWL